MENFSFRGEQKEASESRSATRPNESRSPQRSSRPSSRRGVKGIIGAVAGLLVVIALVVGGVWAFRHLGLPSYIDTGKYQAVFLQNGEFYFGKITSVNDSDVQLEKVFYVQKATPKEGDATQTNLELIKLGSEVHGPEDRMVINRKQVLYIENLKSESKVVDNINKYFEKNNQ